MAKRKTEKAPVSKAKAKKILKDGKLDGKPLTKQQKLFFGARAAGLPVKKKRKK